MSARYVESTAFLCQTKIVQTCTVLEMNGL
jgi:hypothetical protein